jgi:hypothetical protein
VTAYKWLPRALDFIETYRIDPDIIEAVIEHPTSTGVHPMSAEYGYRIDSYRRGDLEACVARKDPSDPAIVFVYLHLPFDNSTGSPQTGSKSSPGGKTAPKGLRDLKARIYAAGYQVKLGGGGHLRVHRPDDTLLMTMGSTPSDRRALTNAWMTFQRQVALDSVRDLAKDANELEVAETD